MQGKGEPDVNREDQQYINEFSRLYNKNKVVNTELKKVNEILESLTDADQAIDESFGNTIKLSIGDTFFESNEEEAKEYLKRMRKKYSAEKKIYSDRFESNKKRLDELKVILYAKFGNRLRLDED